MHLVPTSLKRTLRARTQMGRALFPGLLLAATLAMAALFLSEHYGAPSFLIALLLGLALAPAHDPSRTRVGVAFAARHLLRIGVVLLGVRIGVEELAQLGLGGLALVAISVAVTIAVTLSLGRLLRLPGPFAVISGVATAICGASAALAVAAVLPPGPRRERDVAFAVIGVTTLSTAAMVVYPVLTNLMGFDARATGIFLGATIHDVAQVVGAGYSVGETTGDLATLTKLTRVALLFPVVLIVSLSVRRADGGAAPIPGFVIAFVGLAAANSLGLVPEGMRGAAELVSRACLLTAVAALGLKTRLGEIVELGWRPVSLLLGATAGLAVFVAAVLLLQGA